MTTDEHVLSNQGVLDLSHITSAEELAAIGRIENIGTVVVPESLAGAYAAIPATNVGLVIYLPDGANLRVHTGVLEASGDGLGAATDVLIVTGVLVITSQVTGPLPQRIHVTGVVLAPRGSEPALAPSLAGGTGEVSYYRLDGQQAVKVQSGQVKLSPPMLANAAGSADDILILAGQVIMTEAPHSVGYRRVIVAGQLMAPEAARAVLEPKLEVHGLTLWYTGDRPRTYYDDVSFGPDFFRLLPHPVTLIILGSLTLTEGVTEQMLQDKVQAIYLMGDAIVPAGLIGMMQVLAVELFGTIQAADGPGD